MHNPIAAIEDLAASSSSGTHEPEITNTVEELEVEMDVVIRTEC
jgi:hypothetical protein